MKRILNTMLLLLVAAVVVGLLTMWLVPTPTKVDVAAVSREAMTVTVDGEGKTRVRDRYVVAAPVAGRLRRIALRRGDAVKSGQLIAADRSFAVESARSATTRRGNWSR